MYRMESTDAFVDGILTFSTFKRKVSFVPTGVPFEITFYSSFHCRHGTLPECIH